MEAITAILILGFVIFLLVMSGRSGGGGSGSGGGGHPFNDDFN